MTRRLYRSRNGEILGVCKGIAEWRDYPVDTIRLIVILIAIFTAIAPCLIIYFILGLILPVNPYEDDSYDRGYRGRTAVFEMLPIDRKVRNLIYARADRSAIEEELKRPENNFVSMQENALRLMREGITSAEEVRRVINEED